MWSEISDCLMLKKFMSKLAFLKKFFAVKLFNSDDAYWFLCNLIEDRLESKLFEKDIRSFIVSPAHKVCGDI